jgi:hypothetical protein
MSNILEFRKTLAASDLTASGVGLLDGLTGLVTPLQLPERRESQLQVCAITISDRIPNFFNAAPYYEWNNTLLRVHTNQPGTNRDIQLTRGLYITPEDVADAINAAITADVTANWWTVPTAPGLTITSNPITDQVVVTIDSTKLKAPHTIFTLDLRKSTTGTDIATTLGFTQGMALMTGLAGTSITFTSNQEVTMDTQGTACDIQSTLISTRRRNDVYVRTLAIIPFAGKLTPSDNTWPPAGQVSPTLIYDGNKRVDKVKIEIKTSAGRPMLFMSGAIHVIIAFLY